MDQLGNDNGKRPHTTWGLSLALALCILGLCVGLIVAKLVTFWSCAP